MSPKRGDRAAPPPIDDEWDVRFATAQAASGWEDLCAQAPGNTRWAWDLMRKKPGPPETPRHSQLRGKLATGEYGGRPLDRWEIEVTGGGRIFYLLDREKPTVRIEVAGTGHPKVTDKELTRFGPSPAPLLFRDIRDLHGAVHHWWRT